MKGNGTGQISLIEELRGNVYLDKKEAYEGLVLGTYGEGGTLSEYTRDFSKRLLPMKKQLLYRRLRYLQRIFREEEIKKHNQIVALLHRVSDLLKLSSQARERAINVYLKTAKRIAGTNRRDLVALAAASILLAVRELGHNAPVTLQEIVESFNNQGAKVKPMSVVKKVKTIEQELGGKIRMRSCKDYLWRLTSLVVNDPEVRARLMKVNINPKNYSHKLLMTAIKFLNKVEDKRNGRRPYIVAVTSLYAADRYLAFKEGYKPILTQKILAEASKVSEWTIRNHYNMLFRELVLRLSLSELLNSSNR